MASASHLPADCPSRRPCPYGDVGTSNTSIQSTDSSGTVQHYRHRSLSGGSSLSSLSSLWAPAFRRNIDHASIRSGSTQSLTLRRILTTSDRPSTSDRSTSETFSGRASVASALSLQVRRELTSDTEQDDARLAKVAESEDELGAGESWEQREGSGIADGTMQVENTTSVMVKPTHVDAPLDCHADNIISSESPSTSPKQPLMKRWMSTLKRRKQANQPSSTPRSRWTSPHSLQITDFGSRTASPAKRRLSQHKQSDSQGSSLALITAVRSATVTLASESLATVSGRNGNWLRRHQRSSIISTSDPRPSVDSQRSVFDEAAGHRSRKRRDKVDELIKTEESYIADIKALSNAYFTVLGHQSTPTTFTRSLAQRTMSDIVHLHNDLLDQLHRVVPFAACERRSPRAVRPVFLSRAHNRWHSIDVVPSRTTPKRSKLVPDHPVRRSLNISRSSEDELPIRRCAPQVVKLIVKTFLEYMTRFAVYEEYGANYELVQRDVDETQRAIAVWPDFDKGVEALCAHVNPVKSREENRRKAMTIKDMLIKPIQRLPRYELLFTDLYKLTPMCDDPDTNTSLQELLFKLNETCRRMNEAKDDPTKSRMLETTWLLGERLTFSKQVPRSVFLQLLGQVHLCGCLYLCYRSKDRMKGAYVICILFGSTLLLATADEGQLRYCTSAGVPLANATIVETDNGKGLQCHTAPHSWKLVFEYSARMYEVILTACSVIEAEVWQEQLSARIQAQSEAVAEGLVNVFEIQSPLINEMRSVGKAFGKPSSFVRRMSVRRTATVGPTTDLNQVIIKNTQAVKEVVDNTSHTSLQIPRSQSVATPSHVQTLAPRRADRVRLESLLIDVWTKELLPYPGMQPRRSDPIRASANHVIRKFSMASITSNFSSSKRSGSHTSISGSREENMPPPRLKGSVRDRGDKRAYRPPLVDFHSAPEAFLPADFELQGPSTTRKKSALRTLTMTMERPFSPLLGNDSKESSLRRAQSVREVSLRPPVPKAESTAKRPATPLYTVVQDRAKVPTRSQKMQPSEETVADVVATSKTPKKSKSKNKIMRMFG